jgi:photosystem II stability/assembly factor-like uncharacterized protein
MLARTMAAAFAACCTVALAAAPSSKEGWRDVLDTPALKSPLAARALLNGLTRAGDRLVAVGQRGHVLWSDDGGKTWTQADVPVSSDLVAVSFADATHGWAVGHDGVVLHSADAGRTWKLQRDGRSAGPQGTETPLLDVWFGNASHGYAVGAFGLVLRTEDGGATWEPWHHAVDNPKNLHLYAVRGVGDDVYMVGEQGLTLKLDRTAGRFRALDMPYKGTLFGVTGSDHAIVVHGLRGSVLRSVDGGRSWQTIATGLQVGMTASTRTDDGRLVLVSQAGHVLVSRDDGATFRTVAIERPLPAAAVVAPAAGTLVVAGPRGVQPLSRP